jgi:cytochrome b561
MNASTTPVPKTNSELQSYDATSITLHWVTALLVLALWIIAHYIDDFPRGPARINMRSTHILLGVTLAMVLIYRIYWRAQRGVALPSINSGRLATLTRFGHVTLYVLVATTLLLGATNALVRGDSFFNQWTIPSIAPGNRPLRKQIGELHELAANVILIVAGLHALIALVHHFLLHDNTLRRMLPRRNG